MTTKSHILRLDASANPGDSISRELGDRLIEGLNTSYAKALDQIEQISVISTVAA